MSETPSAASAAATGAGAASGQPNSPRPAVLFVCSRNGGKSQMAAGMMRHVAGDAVRATSAGTNAGTSLNALSVASLHDVGVDIADQAPRQLTDEMVRSADLVVVLASEAHVDPALGTTIETWHTDEPSTRGIDGPARMDLIRDDITRRVHDLAGRLT